MQNDLELNSTKNGSINAKYETGQDSVKENNSNSIHERKHVSTLVNNHRSNFIELHLIKYNTPLRPKINQIQYRIHEEILKLLKIFDELKIQDEEVIRKLIVSIKENNIQYSSLISSEVNKIRKTGKAIVISKIVLDTLQVQIHSVSNFKDLVETLTPSITVIKSLRSMLFSQIRASELDLRSISDLLIDVLINAGQAGGHLINFKIANDRASTILHDASYEAEDKIRKEFLPIPELKI
ncbi:MAG TPA: hypothetical protein VFP25_06650 [Nitrososphaeraceae archaeon]|nr:hypothetical protein [Nitrososphaeraceae archaeon]